LGIRALVASGAAFVVVALAAIWLLGRQPTPSAGPFFALRQRMPDTLVVVAEHDTTTIVPEGEHGWEVVRPVRYPADQVLVNAIVHQLTDLKVDRRFALTPEKMDTYGMRFPQGVIRAAYRDGGAGDTLVIGAFTFDDAYQYIRNGSRDEVGLLPARTARGFLLKGTNELRDTELLPFLENRVARFSTLDASGDTLITLERQKPGGWRILRPYPGPAQDAKVREYLESLSHMHVDTFVNEGEGALEAFGLVRPRAGARVRLEDGSVLGLDLGGSIPNTDLTYAHTLARPHVFGVSDKYLPVLLWSADRLRRTSVLPFGMKDATAVSLEDGGRTWTFAIGDSLSREVKDLLGNWILIEAHRFAPATSALLKVNGLDRSSRALSWRKGETLLARIELGREAGGDVPLYVSKGEVARPAEILFVPRDSVLPIFTALEQHAAGTP
jgi:uncharacterized protein DUF4340